MFCCRLQRAQEERTRRGTGRYYDESVSFTGNELNGNYRNGTTNNHSLSSSSSYSRRGDQPSYVLNNSSTGQQHPGALSAYPPHASMIATVNSSGQTHLAYFPTNSVGKIIEKHIFHLPISVTLGYFDIQSCWYSKSTIS